MSIDTDEEMRVQPYDPRDQPLDLSRVEKRRVTALMLAIQAWEKTIITDANYLKEMHDAVRRGDSPKLGRADTNAICITAAQFDHFIEHGGTAQITQEMRDVLEEAADEAADD